VSVLLDPPDIETRPTVKSSRIAVIVAIVVLAIGASAIWRLGSGSHAPGMSRGGQLIGSIRAEPRSFNRLVVRDQIADLVAWLTQQRLIRVNRSTFDVEPQLADSWQVTPDGRVYTLHLRPGLAWSDGTPFSADDVVFSMDAVFDPKSESALASALAVNDQRLRAHAVDAQTVEVVYPGPSGLGIRLLDNLTIVPKHKLAGALLAGTFAGAWDTKTPPSDMVGMGPFVLREYQPGQRLVFERNPHYWRKAPDGGVLPYLDRIVLEIVSDQNAELLRLTSGNIDMTQNELRPEDYVVAKRAADQGRLSLIELGVGTDADAFWFCLKPEAKNGDPRFAFVRKREFRQAISYAVNRQQFADSVFLGAAVPIWGPITPGNKLWYWPDVPKYEYDPTRAKELLKSIGLEDRNGNGVVEDPNGIEARFTVILGRGVTWWERGAAELRDQVAKVGIALDLAPLEFGAMIQKMLASEYDAIYYRFLMSDIDPALNKDLWLSAGSAHVWNLGQKQPATDWERRIDMLMIEQAATTDANRRRDLFNMVQRVVAENLPIIYFVAPKVYYAQSTRVRGTSPSVLRPPVLWNADTISVTGPPAARGTS
jgi:peptide/nickel transport system substrate-binding protein